MNKTHKTKMTGAKQFGLGIKTYGQAIGFIFRNKLGWTFLVPVAMTVLLFVVGQAVVNSFVEGIKDQVFEWVGLGGEGFWSGFFGVIIKLAVNVLAFFLFIFIIGFLVIILMSPILAYLSEKTEQILTGNKYNIGIGQMLKDIGRGVTMAFRNMLLQLLCMLLLVIPVFGVILVFFISSYFYGFSFIDLNNERQKLNIRESVAVVRKYKWIAIGNGMMYSLCLLIPFCTFFMPFFASIVAVVAAALAMHKTDAYKMQEEF